MKQVQYRRAAQSSGFRPVQISGNEIARMREESARVVQGMREQRNAEIKDREAQLAQEKEGQALERRLREKNRQIETANHQRQLTGLQQEARANQAQYEQNQRDNAQILKGLTTLSDSAGKAYSAYVEAKEDEQIAENVQDYRNNKAEQDLEAFRNELILDENDEQQQALGDEYVANGGDPLVPAKRRNQSDRVRRESLKAQAAFFYQYKYPQLLQEAIRAQEEKLGRKMEAGELSAYMIDVSRIVSEKFRTEGGMSLKPGSMKTALESQAKLHQSILSGARSDEIKQENQLAADNATTILTQNPAEFDKNVIPSFRTIYRVNGYDYAKAHNWYVSLATMRGPDGNFLFSMEQLGSTVLQQGQKPYAKEFPGRFEAVKAARLKADNEYRKLALNSENLAFKEAEQQTLEYITENNTQDVVDAAVGYFTKTYGKVPESITKFQENYTLEAQAKAQQIENIQALAIDGFIQKEHVEALKRLDVKAGKQLEERYNAQEARYRTGTYKDLSDAFKTTANGVTTYGSQKPNSAASLALQRGMRSEFRRRVDQAVAGGADFNTSAELIAKEIENEVRAGAREPSSLWYRKPSGPGGAAEFPNLYSKDGLSKFEAARRSFQAIQQSIQDDGIAKTLDTAESILTRDEIVSIIGGYGKPGFTIPTDVLAVSGLGNGLDPFTIINRQIKALGDPNLQPLEPPAIIKSINELGTEQAHKELFALIGGPLQRTRALQRMTGTVARPSNLRAGFAQDNLKRSFTDALTYDGNKGAYQHAGTFFQDTLGFTVTEHPDFGGVDPVHAGNSFHGYGEAFDIKHMTGDYQESIDKTKRLKELIRSMGLFKEIIGPGDWDPNAEQTPEQLLYKRHQFHLHLGGLMRPLTAEDIEKLNSLK